jgi:hypothetical protein
VSTIISGTITAFYLFDVGDVIALPAVAERVGTTTASRFASKQPSPAYVQYRENPVIVDGARLGMEVPGHVLRFKVFDYGVVSVALSRPMPPDWDDLLVQGAALYENAELLHDAERVCRSFLARIAPAVTRLREALLTEDYFVFAVSRLEGDPEAATVQTTHGGAIAQLLRGERERLSDQERTEVLRHSLSYLACDLVVPTWNGAFIYDTEAGVQGAMEILEFTNSQLLQFRYYDALLDRELEGIYAQLQGPFWVRSWFSRRYSRAARYVHALFVDVNELTDRTENALKIAGDVYAARLLALAGARLGLDHWKATVEDKLETLDDIYRFAVEQGAMTRGELMEAAVVLILVLELGLIIAGVMR